MALAAMTLANAMVLVDQTAVPLALPSVMQDLGVGTQKAQWVVNASLLPLAAFLVLGGRLGDLFGHRRIFLVGITTFTVASACGGFAPSYEVLIAFRVLQGLGGALMLPTTVAIVSARYPGEQRGRALGVMGGAAAVAGALGPVIGGVLTSLFDWRAVLLINIPLALVAVLATLRSVPRDAPSTESHHVDWLGATLLAFTLIGVIGGVTQSETVTWSSPSVSFPLIVAVAAGLQIRIGLVHHAHETPLFRHGEIGSTVLSHLISGFLDGILGTEDLDLAGEKFRQFHAVGLLGGREASVAAFTAPGVSRRAGISAPCNFPRPTREPAYPARIRTTVPPASHDSNGDIPRPTRATFLPRGHLPPPYIQL